MYEWPPDVAWTRQVLRSGALVPVFTGDELLWFLAFAGQALSEVAEVVGRETRRGAFDEEAFQEAAERFAKELHSAMDDGLVAGAVQRILEYSRRPEVAPDDRRGCDQFASAIAQLPDLVAVHWMLTPRRKVFLRDPRELAHLDGILARKPYTPQSLLAYEGFLRGIGLTDAAERVARARLRFAQRWPGSDATQP